MDQILQYAEQLPIEVQQLAEAHYLGSLTAIYRRKTFSPLARLTGLIIALVFLVCPISAEWYLFANQIASGGINAAWATLISVVTFDLIWYIVVIFVIVAIYRHRNDRAFVFAEGFIAHARNETFVSRWDQIETIWRGTKDNEGGINMNTLRLRKTDGTEIKNAQMPHVQNISALCDTIEREFVRINLPAAIDSFRSGVPLTFGKLTISLSGVDKGKGEMLLWSQITHFEAAKTTIAIRKVGRKHLGWFGAAIPDTPNACLLRELVAYIRA